MRTRRVKQSRSGMAPHWIASSSATVLPPPRNDEGVVREGGRYRHCEPRG
ncbi:MAG: hypothetical protein LBT00_11185 [Spirochaetaceae bacterium]|nr:hypothetical protein [Spirochaetaceae bacterium]